MKPIQNVLIANRGEIACRVIRTCRQMGIATVAVFSDADADAPHVRLADRAVRLGPAPSAESYLNVERILEAARMTGADAIHPGYGFLAENAAFAQACMKAGVTFIGPSPEAIRSMGSKIEAKRTVSAAGVPVIPGYQGDDQSLETLAEEARKIGFPVLLKASAGGGGKGMRVVREESALEPSIEGARRESLKAFGDDRLLIEKYIDNPRHVEIQILGDNHGNLVHLFERECSIQRRHQKIIEESPSVALDETKRAEMGAAAVAAGKSIAYENAGTVEFILAPDGEFYFLEVNTRLQVEHPVTEMVTGLDLVRCQIRVAQGEPLPFTQDELTMSGAAVECRLYAEDPDNDFLPASGTVADWAIPDLEGLRVDTGVELGTEVSVHYDPMLAKVITYAPTRVEATRKMVRALEQMAVHGLTTNRDFLLRVLKHPAYLAGEIDTHFIAQHAEDLGPRDTGEDVLRRFAIAAALKGFAARADNRRLLPRIEYVYRTNPLTDETFTYRVGEQEIQIAYRHRRDGSFAVRSGEWSGEATIVDVDDAAITIEDGDGLRDRYRAVVDGSTTFVTSQLGAVALVEQPRFPDPLGDEAAGGCDAPMTGTIVKVAVEAGQSVEAGQTLVIMEAMKMEHTISAPHDATVEEVMVEEGELVDEGTALVTLSEES